jgi:hypothetical protein
VAFTGLVSRERLDPTPPPAFFLLEEGPLRKPGNQEKIRGNPSLSVGPVTSPGALLLKEAPGRGPDLQKTDRGRSPVDTTRLPEDQNARGDHCLPASIILFW